MLAATGDHLVSPLSVISLVVSFEVGEQYMGKTQNHTNSIEWWLAVGGSWRLAVGGGWRLTVIGLAVGGWRLMVLGAVLKCFP